MDLETETQRRFLSKNIPCTVPALTTRHFSQEALLSPILGIIIYLLHITDLIFFPVHQL